MLHHQLQNVISRMHRQHALIVEVCTKKFSNLNDGSAASTKVENGINLSSLL